MSPIACMVCAALRGERFERAGGRGYLSDVGSGFFIGRQALNAYFRHVDSGSSDSAVFEKLLTTFSASGIDKLVQSVYSAQGPRIELIASLAPHVLDAAKGGDGVCASIVGDSVAGFADLISSVVRKLGIEDGIVGLLGGVFSHRDAAALLVEPLRAQLDSRGLSLDLKRLGFDTKDPLLLALENTFAG